MLKDEIENKIQLKNELSQPVLTYQIWVMGSR